jgi:probable HAF family extracellular repeat protein
MKKLPWILGVATLLAVAVDNAGGVQYFVTDLGTLGTGTRSYAYGVNNSGAVVGYAYADTSTSNPHAFLYANGTMTDISASWSTPNATARAINDSGRVVGYLSTSPLHGFMYSGGTAGTMTDMSTLPGELNGATSQAFAVTSTGIIAGSGGLSGQGWVYDGTTSYAAGKLSSSANSGTIVGVNNSQWAVGSSSDGTDSTIYPIYSYHNGSSWVAYKVTPYAGQANFINSSATIVGNTGMNAWVATYTGGGYAVATLPALSGSVSNTPLAISDTGVVVGTSNNKAFVATQTGGTWTTTDLNTLLIGTTGWTLRQATGISTNGTYICGYGTIGGRIHGFRLAPAMLGDANLDGTVDIADLSILLTNFDKTGLAWADGDFNGDGTVDISDLSNMLTNYDHTAGVSAAGVKAVPEPSSLLLVGAIAIGLSTYAWRRRRV